MPGEQQFPKAKSAAIRALQLDPSSAVGHGVLSSIMLFCDWNWREAKRETDSAVRLNPESTVVRASGMWLYEWIGQPERAVIEAQRAVMSEPCSSALQMLLGKALISCGDYDGALDHFSNLIETNPEYTAQARCQRAQALILSDQPARAILDLLFLPQDRAEDLALRLPLLAQAYADDGQEEKAQQVYETLLRMANTEYVAQTNLIALALSIRLRSAALRHLENAVARREPALPLLRPRLKQIRKSDAFKALIGAIESS
jgi:tetratricopeptide (TPR) repeat protein